MLQHGWILKNYAKWNKLVKKGQMLYDFTYMEHLE